MRAAKRLIVVVLSIGLVALAILTSAGAASAWSEQDCINKCRGLNGSDKAAMNWCVNERQPVCASFRGQPSEGKSAVDRSVNAFRAKYPNAKYTPTK